MAYYLNIRFQAFLKYVLYLYLRIIDHQIHYEQQYHGSSYIYYLFQTKSSPLLDLLTDKQQATFVTYQGQQITAQNPNQLRLLDIYNLASLVLANMTNTADQFIAFLNQLQLYSAYCLSYYLQTKKGVIGCQFFYLRLLTQQAIVITEINYKNYMFTLAQN